MSLFGGMPYAELQSMIDDPPGKRNWWTAEYLEDLPGAAIKARWDPDNVFRGNQNIVPAGARA